MTTTKTFNHNGFCRSHKVLKPADFDFSSVGNVELSEAELQVLIYMADIESSIGIYARNALVTRFAFEPQFCEFISLWMQEEYGHRDLFRAYLKAYFENRDLPQPQSMYNVPKQSRFVTFGQKIGWFTFGMLGMILPKTLENIYLSWGTANEYLTASGYSILGRNTKCPVLKAMLGHIRRQEYRHGNAYQAMANDRIQTSLSRRLNRVLLGRFWQMVGVGIRSKSDAHFVAHYLIAQPGSYDVLTKADKAIERTHGLVGIGLLAGLARKVA